MSAKPSDVYAGPREDDLAGVLPLPPDDDLDRLRERFSAAVAVLFRERVSRRLSRMLSLSQRDVQYLLSGQQDPDPSEVEELERIASLKQSLTVDVDLQRLMTSWRDAGLPDEVIAAALADAHQNVFGREID